MHLTALQALWLLLASLPLALYVAWSDLKFMRIPNTAVLAMVAVFVVVGAVVLPLDVYLWRGVNLLVILAVGFLANAVRLVGGGDAKYAAAIAPFFAAGDFRGILVLFSVMLLLTFIVHRLFRRIGFIRRLTPDWKSWQSGKDFPMGLALSGTLIAYLALAYQG